MENLVQKLVVKLDEITSGYNHYREILMLEQGCLASGNVVELSEMVREKDRIAEKIQTLEEERIALHDSIADKMKKERRVLKVEDIAAQIETVLSKKLINAKATLKDVLIRVKVLNDINNQLLNDSIKYIKGAMELVTGKQDSRQGYGKGGEIRTSVNIKRNLVNTRA